MAASQRSRENIQETISMVRIRAMMTWLPARATIPLIRMFTRPVTVIVPAIIPAIPHAAATEIVPCAPAARASKLTFTVLPRASTKPLKLSLLILLKVKFHWRCL